MQNIFNEITQRCLAGERLAFCTLVRARGSTPQCTGAKMLVLASGNLIGTLGGGCVEAEVRRRALELLSAKRSELLTFRLDHDYGWDDGLICGGIMDIQVDTLEGPAAAARFTPIATAITEGKETKFEFNYQTKDGPQTYSETISPTPTLVIAGGGHVGLALASIATQMDFHITIIEDRPEFASQRRFPHARQRIVGEIELELARYPITDQTYIVILTRGHRHDGRALAAVIRSPARYLGLIGSKKKIRTILADLAAAGVPRDLLYKVHAPIGLEFGAITVPEIAVSIAAELIAVRRGHEGAAVHPMWLGKKNLDAWLDQKPD